MYHHCGAFTFSVATPATAAMLPLDVPLSSGSGPLWLTLGGFAIFAACSAVKRIAPTWDDLVGVGDDDAYSA